MAHVNYKKLYDYLTQEERLTRSAALRNIWRVSNLPKVFKAAVLEITEGRLYNVADFCVDGVTLRDLVKEEKMKFIQAVFFLDWLRREPANARSFMASRRLRNPIQKVTEEEREQLLVALKHAKEITGKDAPSIMVPEDNSGKDIDIENESEQVGVMAMEVTAEHAEISTEETQQMVDDATSQVKDAK